jgi:hypothetical protein
LIEQGDLSHAARVLRSSGLAFGNEQTLAELRVPSRRPPSLREPLPPDALDYTPAIPLRLDAELFAKALQSTRRGLSPGLCGIRYGHLKLCMEDDATLELLTEAAERIAQGDVPEPILQAMRISQLTALRKPNGRARGVAAGDTLRRLVGKTLARQFQDDFRSAVLPSNFGLCDRSGTEALAHLIQVLTDMDPRATITCIDGVGAFDHILRSRIFRQLMDHDSLREVLPFVRAWYSGISSYLWADDSGAQHVIEQGEGGEQGGALMPALFSLALKPALDAIQARLEPGELAVAYLDDIYLITPPGRARAAHDLAAEVLREMCGIEVNHGKLVSWNKEGGPPPSGSFRA